MRELAPRLVGLWENNYRVYGARELWKAARRAGLDVGRDQVARLMRNLAARYAAILVVAGLSSTELREHIAGRSPGPGVLADRP